MVCTALKLKGKNKMRTEATKVFNLKGNRTLKIYQDTDTDSPRDWDNLGRMVCFHRRYNLGDKHDYKQSDFKSWVELESELMKQGATIIMPLYLYDHSGITISTAPFSCRWDSGQVGFIYCTREDIKKNWNIKKVTQEKREHARRILEGEVKTYDQFLTGEVYGFVIEKEVKCDECGHIEDDHIDSCWGFYGSDVANNGILDYLDEADRAEVKRQLGGGK